MNISTRLKIISAEGSVKGSGEQVKVNQLCDKNSLTAASPSLIWTWFTE